MNRTQQRPQQSQPARRSAPAQRPERTQGSERPTGILPTAGNAARYIIRELELEDSTENWRTLRDRIADAIKEVASDEVIPYYAA